ncbi:2-oxoglutarate dehydrogenase E1 component [Paenibacillus sediminis]|uniref:2-oxoglutarate dehydrogenase E1 component n=1 Tax=Paenibacillus sediminis TaxID=664909 RepID=A0ABS4GZ96_9BACL|nr:2-oxoglutarate dehydrogenase E1 component [Paenibacillus sediminis]MBP1935215.1 2-oxoglutarate dehydrogenase E1 component [Paenibacillus sediminis]
MKPSENVQGQWQSYYGPNLGYVQEQYEKYVNDPGSVDSSFRELFANFGAPPASMSTKMKAESFDGNVIDQSLLKKSVDASKLVSNIRTYGHLAAQIDPLGISEPADTKMLEPQTYQLTQADLSALPAAFIWDGAPASVTNGWEAIQRLRELYTGTTAYEFSHIHNEEEREWLNSQVESNSFSASLKPEEQKELLQSLIQAEQFEDFLHRTFVGQKRFSVEGNDVLVPLVNEIVRVMAGNGVSDIVMGMAHRGRLNVLAHVLGKPYTKIFSEFYHSPNKKISPSEGLTTLNYGSTGDVKYHLGATRTINTGDNQTRITLANNPSHLEFVNAVVEGFARAAQEERNAPGYPRQNVDKSVAIVIHGDSAFPGEGIVVETLNIGRLPGYQHGGTIHIIANNKIGFTTESKDSRSTRYSSDPAKGYEIPIVHVNADDPEACIAAARLASEYRKRFKKDFLIDLIGYRRYGHNETDDPETTQPTVYQKVKNHPTVSLIYADRLKKQGVLKEGQYEEFKENINNHFKEAFEVVKQQEEQAPVNVEVRSDKSLKVKTAVPMNKLREINADLLKWPEGFRVYPKLQRILERRATALNDGEKVDWGQAETLAFATILADGRPIRITGQDAERATFAHRNLVLHDAETGELFCPLHQLPQAKASFAIHNSPLSETAVLAFEYGYNVFSPETLVIWEAQYGDFANVAQVMIDQFISSGRSKWGQKSSLVMLLPHSYEGQGPEHSSARLERFLQLSAEENWTVVNLSSSAQYFHLLRRQAALTESEEARPLIVMAPKSLIRNPRAASPASAFSEGEFKPVVEQEGLGKQAKKVKRVILCTGKVAVDLEDALEKEKDKDFSWLHIVRTEQLYPFPRQEIEKIVSRFPNLQEMIWVQEEPKNMGSWSYIEPLLRGIAPEGVDVSYIGRPERSSPASGYAYIHAFEQQQIFSLALNQSSINEHISLGR